MKEKGFSDKLLKDSLPCSPSELILKGPNINFDSAVAFFGWTKSYRKLGVASPDCMNTGTFNYYTPFLGCDIIIYLSTYYFSTHLTPSNEVQT